MLLTSVASIFLWWHAGLPQLSLVPSWASPNHRPFFPGPEVDTSFPSLPFLG